MGIVRIYCTSDIMDVVVSLEACHLKYLDEAVWHMLTSNSLGSWVHQLNLQTSWIEVRGLMMINVDTKSE